MYAIIVVIVLVIVTIVIIALKVILVILQVEFRTRPFVNKPLRDEKKVKC